mgnify:FL=1
MTFGYKICTRQANSDVPCLRRTDNYTNKLYTAIVVTAISSLCKPANQEASILLSNKI